MVEDGMLEEIRRKAENLLKHFPCRDLKVLGVERILSDSAPTVVGFCIRFKTPEEDCFSTSFFVKDALDEKNTLKTCIRDLKNKVPEIYSSLSIVNVKDQSNSFLERFSLKNEREEFKIIQIPYRQLKILCGDSEFFLDISKVSYQKMLARILKEKEWPASIPFEDVLNILKRKEIVTLCIQLAQI